MKKILPILAIETSGDLCSAAVVFDELSFVEMNYLQKHVHSKKIIDIVDSVLLKADLTINDISSIAISTGPGSFTGLRIGFSVAKGLAFGSNIGIIPVPTFNAFAFQIGKTLPDNSEFILTNKAGMEDIYAAKYLSRNNGYEVLEELKVIKSNKYDDFCGSNKLVFGNLKVNKDYPNASSIGLRAYLFEKDLLTFDYDYLEPEYFGNPFIKNRKK